MSYAPTPVLVRRVFEVLQPCRGREMAVTSPVICRQLRLSPGLEREVRRIIEENANDKWPGVLCAIPGVGYFFAEDLSDIVSYRNYLVALKDAARLKLARFDASAEKQGFHLKEAA